MEFINMLEETPAKIFSLLGVSMFSMFFLFAVATTNASFEGADNTLPDIFAPQNVVSILDNVSNSYSNFVSAYFINPAKQDFALAYDNIAFIAENVAPQ